MLSFRNLSPRQLSFLIALVIAVPVSIGVYFFEDSWKIAGIFFILLLVGAYAIISLSLERFIYRRIKLIYKLISQTKATKREEIYYKYLLPPKSIDEVKDDVEEWAEKRNEEIELLRNNEQYRKEFLQNLSHEFKTPVFAIQGFIETLLDGAMYNPEINKKFLEKTSRNVERLTNLINDLDEISKLEMGELVLYKENFIIQDMIRDVFDSVSIISEKQNIKMIIKKGCEAPLTVFADKEKIRQVITNLIENSIKYGKPDGNITASAYKTDDKKILIEISDEGMGIAENDVSRIFERFYRTDGGRSRDISGSGLGLSICKHIVEAHGQSIHARSTEGVGTTIGFTLDAKKDF